VDWPETEVIAWIDEKVPSYQQIFGNEAAEFPDGMASHILSTLQLHMSGLKKTCTVGYIFCT
jgi:hypothetical protein